MIQHAKIRDPEAARAAADAAVDHVARHADPNYLEALYQAGVRVARRRRWFTADHIWEEYGEPPEGHRPGSALGPVMRRLKDTQVAVPTGDAVQSERPSRHRAYIPRWRSKVYDPALAPD